jgi:hypothetical protein
MTGFAVAVGGDERLPSRVRLLLEPTESYSTSWVAHLGAGIVGGVWLVLAVLPEVALVNELRLGRATTLETGAIVLNVIGCIAWLTFLGWRYRPA